MRGAFLFLILLTPVTGFGYAGPTHEGLTAESISYREAIGPTSLSVEAGEAIIRGSVFEDDPDLRTLNHFLDPTTGRGILGYRAADDWGFSRTNDNVFTWQEGIRAYVEGRELDAAYILGHLVHLAQDMTVPEHVRNDPHIPFFNGQVSVYELWAKENKTRETLRGLGAELAKDESQSPGWCSSFMGCMSGASRYTNGNYLSQGTVGSQRYAQPVVDPGNADGVYLVWDDPISKTAEPLLVRSIDKDDRVVYLLEDKSTSVLPSYFSRLSRVAIPASAELIDTFYREAEFAKAEAERARQIALEAAVAEAIAYTQKSSLAQSIDGGWTFFVERPFLSVYTPVATARDKIERRLVALVDATYHAGRLEVLSASDGAQVAGGYIADAGAKAYLATGEGIVAGSYAIRDTSEGAGREAAEASQSAWQELLVRLEKAKADLSALSLALAAVSAERSSSPNSLSEPSGEIAGTSTASHLASAVFADSQESRPEPRIDPGVPGGLTVLILSDQRTEEPEPEITLPTLDEEATLAPDTTPPESPLVTEPNEGNRILATTSVTIRGIAEPRADVLLSYRDGSAEVLVRTNADDAGSFLAVLMLPEGATTLILVAIDAAGNVSPPATLMITVIPPTSIIPEGPRLAQSGEVVVAEVLWAGTSASSEDEFIAITNATREPLALDGMELATESGSVQVVLKGTLAPREERVYARAREDGSSGIRFDGNPVIVPRTNWSGLDDAGEAISIVRPASEGDPAMIIDELPRCEVWCGYGSVDTSIERFRLNGVTGDWTNNWREHPGDIMSGSDADGNSLMATPGERNALDYRLSLGDTIVGVFRPDAGVYILPKTLTVPIGSSLALESGSVVKFFSRAVLRINGALDAHGTEERPVIFTTITEDSYGGDTLGDGDRLNGATMTPAVLRAGGIEFQSGSTGTFTEAILEGLAQGLYANRASLDISGMDYAENGSSLYLYGVSATATDLSIRDLPGEGISIGGGSSVTLASTSIAQVDSAIVAGASRITSADLSVENVRSLGVSIHNGAEFVGDGLTVEGSGQMRDAIILQTGSKATVTDAVLSNSGNYGAMVFSDGSALTIASSSFSGFAIGVGVYAGSVEVASSTLVGNGTALAAYASGVAEIHDSLIDGNAIGVGGYGTVTVDATGNDWGDPSGPRTVEHPEALGDSAVGNVRISDE